MLNVNGVVFVVCSTPLPASTRTVGEDRKAGIRKNEKKLYEKKMKRKKKQTKNRYKTQ